MKRLLRILLNAATALSLILFVATVVLWVRGRFVVDGVMSSSPYGPAPVEIHGWSAISARGAFDFERSRFTIPQLNAAQSAGWDAWRVKLIAGLRWSTRPVRAGEQSGGFSFERTDVNLPTAWSDARIQVDGWKVRLPCWLAATVAAILPALAGITQLAKQRRRIGFCAVCGYDLRATPDRCPECGTIPAERRVPGLGSGEG